MPVNFGGAWTLADADNYDKFLIDMKVPEPVRKVMMLKADLEIVHKGDTVQYKRTKGDDILKLVVVIGKKYTENAYGHTEVRVCKWEGDKLVIKAAEGDNHWTSSIEIINGQLIAIDTSQGGVSGKRIFDKV